MPISEFAPGNVVRPWFRTGSAENDGHTGNNDDLVLDASTYHQHKRAQ